MSATRLRNKMLTIIEANASWIEDEATYALSEAISNALYCTMDKQSDVIDTLIERGYFKQ